MKPTRSLLAALLIALPFSVFAIGAIAVDDEEGQTDPGYGYVTGAASKQAASAGAMKECRASGNKGCKVVVWFESCGAYAHSRDHYGIGYGQTKKVAEAKALEECGGKSCKILVADCE